MARENPHCGVSGVPFINKTTGAEAIALSMAARVSSERKRIELGERREVIHDILGTILNDGRVARWKAFSYHVRKSYQIQYKETFLYFLTDVSACLPNISR